MNQTIASSHESSFNVQSAGIHAQDHESLLDRIASRLVRVMKGFNLKGSAYKSHKSFIDENLLDPVVGHEISRTLRR